jgi:hypothetical protein
LLLSAAACLGAAIAWGQQTAAPVAAVPFEVPRTPWGDPDLQGAWDYRSITPIQRPPEFGDREFYTEEEIAALEGRAARRMDEPPDEDTPANLVHAQYMTDPGRYVDESRRTSLIVDPSNGRIPPLTEEAQARQEAARGMPRTGGGADSYVDRTLMERCITQGFPRSIMPTLYNNNIKIVQAPGQVAIIHEMIHETRIVPLDGADFSGIRSYIGESRGHWEGDTLVVETRNFNGEVSFQGARENLIVTERFTRVAPDRIGFSMTLEDDSHWTRPWTVAYSMRPTDGDLFEYACHEGNYGLRNILQNARDAERAATNQGAPDA